MTRADHGPAVPLARPPRLRPGSRVAVVAPSGPVPADRLEKGLAVLRAWGLEPVVGAHVLTVHPELDYLAGPDTGRAADLERAWCDPSVDAVFCARGGYGAHRMVDLVDWAAVRAAGPKAFVGYSDITVLHEAFALRAGFATLHGPMVATETFLDDAATREHLRATLFAPETVTTLGLESAGSLVPGRARGVLYGGCVSLLAAGTGAPGGRAHARGGLLVIEDTGEEPYRLDGILTRLLRSGALDSVAGVACGSWQECGPYEKIRAVLADRLGPLGIPVVEELGFGHGATALTIPLGVPAVLDAPADGGRCTLTVDTPALR
ncbi:MULTISPECIES: S66 peptidase family protein [Streptomyces]|uniref:Carboxypeptidase n=1 Tax=Streptomyces griseus subsp. griseus (strain JCM 4626 / CBS 651.72 / NBRC 13350 / KCC S-0626 / ISP 5235) TaxID=455632 RepID=B1VUD7_STRGG|nr:LD-carboxypeptidase [Streptomyces griseus]MBW3703637.1 LD-carboxypeptidase [Streptomyces griseus]BAG17981.1 putative carboxypeptidase [Streptomyces griseus subsp. griseus NBRC 13350]SED60941.1 muramoyltetrapeptide carboxypeptidase [Streptomyces griseus]SQA22643.1 carboxypeptidase [Streptomyces griseus]